MLRGDLLGMRLQSFRGTPRSGQRWICFRRLTGNRTMGRGLYGKTAAETPRIRELQQQGGSSHLC